MLTVRPPSQLVLFLLVLLLAASCSQMADPDWVAEAGLYHDPGYTQPTISYGWLEPFYLKVVLAEAPEDAVVRISWIAVQTSRLDPDTVIKIEERTAENRELFFELRNEGNFWPVGKYQVNIYLNQKLFREIEFEVYHTDIG